MPSALVIVNPAAGRGRVQRLWPQVERALYTADVDFDTRLTSAPLEAQSIAAGAADAGYPAVVGVGGDGTLHEIANGLLGAAGAQASPEAIPMLGAIPLGTGDDFAKNIPPPPPIGGKAFSWQAGVEKIASFLQRGGQAQLFDAARLVVDNGASENGAEDGVTHYMIDSLDVGFGAAAVQNLKTVPRALNGTAAYFAAALKTLWENPLPRLRVQVDEQPPFEMPVILFAVLNGRCFGNGFWATPDGIANDGELDFIYGEKMGRLRILRLMVMMLNAAHVGQSGVHTGRFRRLRIEAAQPQQLEVDGELPFLSARRIEVEVMPKALKVIV